MIFYNTKYKRLFSHIKKPIQRVLIYFFEGINRFQEEL